MKESSTQTKAGFNWLLKMAWRDGKASGKRLMLFMASIVLGIAAVVSIQSFGKNLEDNIAFQSKTLMGADYSIDSNQLPTDRVQKIIDSLGASGREVNFASMAAFSKNGNSKLVQVRGIDGFFPIYGAFETKPAQAANTYNKENGALVDATLMLQYGLKPGDSVTVGALTFPIIGSIISGPGSSAISATVAPPVVIPFRYIDGTGLLQTGSRMKYNYYFKADKNTDVEALDKAIDPILDAENADFDSHTSVSQRLGRRYANFAKFLNLVAFIALLLGCVGIASSVHIYIKEKLRAIAVLKCLGATRKQTFFIYLIQVIGMGAIGGAIGTIFGVALQQAFPLFLEGLLPVDVVIDVSLQPIVMGLVLGVLLSILFALFPLLNTWYVSPLQVLRFQEGVPEKSRKIGAFVGFSILVFIFCFSLWLLKDWRYALAFILVIVLIFSILAAMATLFMSAVKKYFPNSWGFTARQSLLNLYRPNNQTMVLILAIGVGSFLISTMYFSKDILLSKASLEASTKSPNVILMDIQSDQTEAVANGITAKGLPVIENIPIITMRMHSIKGKPVNDIRLDSTSKVNQWILNHEFRVTYRDAMVASEKLASGKWENEFTENGLIPISISDNIARDAEVVVGDTLVFNVHGVLMNTSVGSIREVDWGRMQLNFSVIFPVGVLENAPQFNIMTTHAPNSIVSASLQRQLVGDFPNVSVLDLRQVLNVIQGILDKISLIINFMAFFSILTGIVVLIGAVRTSKYQRTKESVLLRTLGAKSKQILKITAYEYLYLGALGSGLGILLSLISSQLLAWFVFESPFIPSLVPFLVLFPGIVILVLFIGLSNSRSIVRSPPLQVLRKDR